MKKFKFINLYKDILITFLMLLIATLLSFLATKISPQSNIIKHLYIYYLLF